MKINEILEKYDIRLIVFDNDLFPRDGAYFPPERTIFLSDRIPEKERDRIILHELGHIRHNPKLYARLRDKYENEAERFMVRELLKKHLANNDIYDFNWLQFANKYKISTSWGQQMIQDEFKKLI